MSGGGFWGEDGFDEYFEGSYEPEGDGRDEMESRLSNEGMELPDVYWREDLLNIENPRLREELVKEAEDLLAEQKELEGRVDSGEISKEEYEDRFNFDLRRRMSRSASKSGLASVGLSVDDLYDLSDRYDHFLSEASGEGGSVDRLERLAEEVERLGPEAAQELLERLYREGELGEEAYELIRRRIRLSEGQR